MHVQKDHVCKVMHVKGDVCAKGGMCKGTCVQGDACAKGCTCACKGTRAKRGVCTLAPARLLARVYHLQVCTHRSVHTRVCREDCVGVGVHVES